jgi:hypothetical protein
MADVLDEVERHGSAMIERGDVQYVITVKRRTARNGRKGKARSRIDIVDPAVAAGEWRWEWTPDGAQFKGPARRRP